MRRKLLFAVLLAIAGASLVSTGAFVDTPTQTASIEMAPSDGPNSVYAVNNSGELTLDLSETNQLRSDAATGVNDDSVTEVVNIFTVTYDGDASDGPAAVWIETPDEEAYDDIEFIQGTDSTRSIHGETHSQLLSPGETVHVGIRIDTTGDHAVEEIDEFTLVAETDAESASNDGPSVGGSSGDGSSAGGDAGGDGSSEVGAGGDEASGGSGGDGMDSGSSGGGTGSDGSTGGDDDPGDSDSPGDPGGAGSNGGDGSENTTAPKLEIDGPSGDIDLPDIDLGDSDDGEGDDSDTEPTGTLTEPDYPGPEETLGGSLFRTLLLLVLFVIAGAGLFSVTRHGVYTIDRGN